MFFKAFEEILGNVWPMLIIICVIAISCRIAYISIHHKKIVLYREILMLVSLVYLLCLYYVVTFQDVNYGGINLVPFKEMFRYDINSRLFLKNVLGNIILFIPYGLFVSYYLKCKKVYWPILLTGIASTTIELVQYKIGRVFDIDDIILNIFGGIVGFLLFIGLDAIKNRMPSFMKHEWFLNLIIIVIIILVIIYGFKIDIVGLWN